MVLTRCYYQDVNYNFRLLPVSHRRRNAQLAGMVLGLMILFVAAFSLRLHTLTNLLTGILPLAAGLLAAYLLIEAYTDKKAIRNFIEATAIGVCSEAEMWALIPPSFSWLDNNPAVMDATVSNGYTYQLASDTRFIVFTFSYVLSTDNGKHAHTYRYTIVATREQQIYPHLFLDGKQNGTSYSYAQSQRLSLEGDFDDYFNLYVPDGSATEALEILTPDVMQVLVDGGRPYDVELVNDLVLLIAQDGQYQRGKLSALFHFIDLFDQQLREKPVDWSTSDASAMESAVLRPRRVVDSTLLLWLTLGLVVLSFLWYALQSTF